MNNNNYMDINLMIIKVYIMYFLCTLISYLNIINY